MNSLFNRQFIQTDFQLLDKKEFLKFVGSSRYKIYLILRRYVWRSDKEHYMGLHKLYAEDRLLASSVTRDVLADMLGIDMDNITKHTKKLDEEGIIKIRRTGRQNVYILGEWCDVYDNGSYREVEWFYMDGKFGIEKPNGPESDSSDQTISDGSEPMKTSQETRRSATGQNQRSASGQTRRSAPDNNKEESREGNSTGTGSKSPTKLTTPTNRKGNPIRQLADLEQSEDEVEYVVQQILDWNPRDRGGERLLRLLARKIPAETIYQAMSEIAQDPNIRNRGATLTARMKEYARQHLGQSEGVKLQRMKEAAMIGDI